MVNSMAIWWAGEIMAYKTSWLLLIMRRSLVPE